MKSHARAIFTGVSPRKCGILIFHELRPESKGNSHRNEMPPLKSSPYPYCITWSWAESLMTIAKVTLTFQSFWTKVLSEGHTQILHRLPDLFKKASVYHDQAQELHEWHIFGNFLWILFLDHLPKGGVPWFTNSSDCLLYDGSFVVFMGKLKLWFIWSSLPAKLST